MRYSCELCGKPIPKARLEALPETRRCFSCSTKNGSDVVTRRLEVGMDADTYKDLLGAIRS